MAKELSNKLLGSKVIELDHDTSEIDTASLCASKHEAWIYVTDESEDGVPNAVEDSIIVGFTALDSSGAGCLDEIFDGVITFLTDPEEWQSTVDEGYDIIWDRASNCEGGWDCTKDYTSAVVYSGVYFATTGVKAIGSGIGAVASAINPCYITTAVMRSEGHDNSPELNSMRRLRDSWVIWQAPNEVKEYYRDAPSIVKEIDSRADSDKIYHRLYNQYILPAHRQVSRGNMGSAHRIYRSMVSDTRQYGSKILKADSSQSEVTTCKPFDDDDSKSFFGTGWHNSNGGEHKVKITINKLYQGQTTTVYQSELAGSDKYTKENGVLIFEPNFRKFKLNGPGTYTVTVQSLAANMDCGNPELDLTTSVVVAEAPASEDPVEATTATLTEGVANLTEATGTRPLYLYAGGVVLGGLLISRYMRLFSGPSEEEVSEDEE